jgi:predicted NBD/HSP70 family sugar kinase
MSGPSEIAPPLIRRVNLSRVLSVLSGSAAAATGTEIMAATGLTRATVHAVCNDLIRLGWVRELPARREDGNQLGRPSRWFAFNEKAGHVLGVDIGPHSSTLLLADLRGTTLAVERISVDDREPAVEHGRRVQLAARRAVAGTGLELSDILAMAMGFAARVDRSGHIRSEQAHSQASFEARRDALVNITGATVLSENDANLAALGERWRGVAPGVDDLAVLLAGERMGVGLIESGRLLRGSQGGAGEMAFLDRVNGVGNADGIGMLARTWGAQAVTGQSGTPLGILAGGVPAAVTAEMVFAAAASGDPVAQRILDRIATRLATVIATLGTLLNPELVVIAGAVSHSAGAMLGAIDAQLPALTATPPRVAASTLGESIVSVGAVKHALDFVHHHALDLDVAHAG